jgi:hypothetical protein
MSMTRYRNTVVGSYPRPTQAVDTMKKPTLTQADTDEMVRWARAISGSTSSPMVRPIARTCTISTRSA